MSSKTKLIALIFGVVTTLFLCYSLAVSKTIALKKEYSVLSTQTKSLQDVPRQKAVLSLRMKHYDSILSTMNLENTSIENNLLRIINIEAQQNNLKVLDFNDSHTFVEETKTLNTFDLTLQGDFTNLLKTIYTLEAENSFGEIVHLDFQKKRDYRKRKDLLSARIFLQQIE